MIAGDAAWTKLKVDWLELPQHGLQHYPRDTCINYINLMPIEGYQCCNQLPKVAQRRPDRANGKPGQRQHRAMSCDDIYAKGHGNSLSA